MSVSVKNKEIVRHIYDGFNSRNLEVLEQFFAPNFVDYTADPDQQPGIKGIKQAWQQIWTNFPEMQLIVEDVIAEGDKVTSRVTLMYPMEENNIVDVGMMIEIVEINDGKVNKLWNVIKFQ